LQPGVLVLFALPACPGTAEGQEVTKRVLLLYDEDKALPGLAMLDQSLRSTFTAGLEANIEFFTESLNV
jgi:hypothetical protein